MTKTETLKLLDNHMKRSLKNQKSKPKRMIMNAEFHVTLI